MNLEKNTIKGLEVPQKESFAEKREDLELVKQILEEQFGQERLPKDLVLEMVNIRKDIRNEIEKENFVGDLDTTVNNRIRQLVGKICHFDFKDEKDLSLNQKELLSSLRLYFNSYRLAHNAGKFRSNVDEIKAKIIKDSGDRKLNFYSEKDKQQELISGYYRPTSGEVKFGGVEVDGIKKTGEESIYNKIAYLSQFPYLFEESLKNNLRFGQGKEITDDKIREVLNDVGLSERFKDINEKLFEGSGDSGKTSGGETSRIGLARVLLKIRNSDCRLVFLDEPTASVDEATKKDIAQIISTEKAKRPETTFIVISHDSHFVEMLNCNIKVRMEKGKIIME